MGVGFKDTLDEEGQSLESVLETSTFPSSFLVVPKIRIRPSLQPSKCHSNEALVDL